MGVLNFLTGTAGYTAILAAFGLAVAAHFFAPRAWSALAWTIAFGVLGAAFVGQREITASVRIEAAEQATKRAEEARAVAEATDKLRTAVQDAGAPELINHGATTHPKARLHSLVGGYKETSDGPTLLEKIGIAAVRAACPHFDGWLKRLEALGGGAV